MENKYSYQTEHFGITEDSIILLRNRFPYKTICLNEIDSILIQKGRDLKNWYWVLIIGILFLSFVIYDLRTIYLIFTEATGTIYIERLLIPVIPLLLGVYSVIISFRKAYVMKVETKNKRYYFSLRDLSKQGKCDDFKKEIQLLYPMTKIID